MHKSPQLKQLFRTQEQPLATVPNPVATKPSRQHRRVNFRRRQTTEVSGDQQNLKTEQSLQSAQPQRNYSLKKEIQKITQKRSQFRVHQLFSKSSLEMNQTTDTSRKSNPLDQVTANSYVVMTSNQAILLERKYQKRKQIASITKLMTALTVLTFCKQQSISLSKTYIKIDVLSSLMEGTSADLRPGDFLSVSDLIHGMLLPSGNDAATALAIYFGQKLFKKNKNTFSSNLSDEQTNLTIFVSYMNTLAKQVGLVNTHFQNPTGLNNVRSYSTASDVGLLSKACLNNLFLKTVFVKRYYSCSIHNCKLYTTRNITWKNTNKLLWKKPECLGIKTGFTSHAGSCLTVAYRLRQLQVIIVVLGCQNEQKRFTDAELLLKHVRNIL